MKRKMVKKIAICHYRVGRTDGVSLEISKRKKALGEMGYQVKLISGNKHTGADFVIPELEFDRPDILKIKENAFFKFQDYENPEDLMGDIYKIGNIIEKKFLQICEKEKFDYLILHNIFSHGRHIAAARAFYNAAKKIKSKTIAFHHDFYSAYLGLYTPQLEEIKKYLNKYVPPGLKKLKHVVISGSCQKLLKNLIGRQAMIFPDMFDFKQSLWKKDNYNRGLLKNFGIKENDLIILQATRVVERKAIELMIDLMVELNKRKKELSGRKLYNGKVLGENFNIVLILGQFVEFASEKYWQKLQDKMKKEQIEFRFLGDRVAHLRGIKKGKKIYSLWDIYTFADLISFPSVIEGWGNQFIEAIFAKKPVVVFEYPVFGADIKTEGYKVVSLGSEFQKNKDGLIVIPKDKTKKAAQEAIKILLDKKTLKILDKNWQIGRKYHGESVLKKFLKKMLK